MQMTGWVSTNTIAVLHRKVQPSLVPFGKKVKVLILKVKQPEVRRYFGLPLSNLLQVWLADFWLPLPSVHISSAPAELREVHALSEY